MTISAAERVPDIAELQDAAIQISKLLRDAKIDAPLRPRVLATLVLAAAHGGLNGGRGKGALAQVDERLAAALSSTALAPTQRRRLIQVLHLGSAEFDRLPRFLPAISRVLTAINVGALLRSDFDFLGVFYEAFLRYGYDNNALGIVFTPRHITRFCVDLVGVGPEDRVVDIACGTGGFLVPAYERMLAGAPRRGSKTSPQSGPALCGCDTNPTVWALSSLNTFFRGLSRQVGHRQAPVQAQIQLGSCFDALRRGELRRNFTRSFLNPPFSQGAEPERDFVDAAMETLAPGGCCAAVVKAGIFADDEHASWRARFMRRHTLLAVISLPEDLFYPTAAPTSILVASAHIPQAGQRPVLMARVWNDGFEKLKNKRVARHGSELPEVKRCFDAMLAGRNFASPLAVTVVGARLQDGNEWSPQEWLPQPEPGADEMRCQQEAAIGAVFRAVVEFPELADVALEDFTRPWSELPPLPFGHKAPLNEFFFVLNGRSAGEKHYHDGATPYVSSGGRSGSIVRLVDRVEGEVFADGGITVTAFGHAALQPWPFLARGNGGSSVRVLLPRYRMGAWELLWFVAQINAQEWRFFYARMAIKSRIARLVVSSPAAPLARATSSLAVKIRGFRQSLVAFSRME